MDGIQIFFWILSLLALVSAIMVVISKNPVYSVLWLVALFFAISGHYVLLNAQFLAIVNIIVYAGAIMVLFLFVLMMVDLSENKEQRKKLWLKLIGLISSGALLIQLVVLVRQESLMKGKLAEMGHSPIGLIKNLGSELFGNYVIPFEFTSILFLSAIVGAIVLAQKDKMME